MENKQGVKFTDYDKTILIFISGDCGSCTKKTISFIKKIDQERKLAAFKKFIVIPDNNAVAVDTLSLRSTTTLIDEGYELTHYGVNFPKNLILEFEKNKLIYQDSLYLDKIDTIAQKYGFQSL